MSDPEVLAETGQWLRYAQQDAQAARLHEAGTVPRQACWLAQQAVEKALKAILVYLQIEYPRTHNLDLIRDLIPDGWQTKQHFPDLSRLTRWIVEARYPGDWAEPTSDDARIAVQQAETVVASVQVDLAQHGFQP